MTEEQTRMFELLHTFKELCAAHGLRYHLAGGTLLGAVRHQGFIPWDDDADVSMPVGDFLKFQELAAELPEHIEIQSERNDPRYPFLFFKLCDTAHPFQVDRPNGPRGVYIDVFPLIPARKPTVWTKFCFQVISVIKYAMAVKAEWTSYTPYKNLPARFGYALLSTRSMDGLRKLRNWLAAQIYAPEGRDYLCSPGGAYKADKEFFPAEWFKETAELTFEGERFAAPGGWDSYLARHYGDYMELPPQAERRSRHRDE